MPMTPERKRQWVAERIRKGICTVCGRKNGRLRSWRCVDCYASHLRKAEELRRKKGVKPRQTCSTCGASGHQSRTCRLRSAAERRGRA